MKSTVPPWVLGVLALLAAQNARARVSRPVPDGVRARVDELRVEHDPRRMSARELRQLPGVGRKLALALSRARDAHVRPEPLAWEDVPGIGEIRARDIRAWCRARGIEPDPLCAGRRPPGAAGYPGAVERLSFALRLGLLVALGACRGGDDAGVAPDSGDPASSSPGEVQAGEHDSNADIDRIRGREGEQEPTASIATRTLALRGGALHALESGRGGSTLVLLLHGGRFTARTWEELGTLEVLARAGYHALALDWPGFGATPKWNGEPDPETLLGNVCDELGAEGVVLVAPSMSGRFAFAFVASAAARVAGLVAIAPAGADGFAPKEWSTPTLLLWGENDDVVPPATGRALASRLAGARLEVLPGAAHPCYLDQPERFHALLLEFLGSLAPPAGARGR